MLHQSEILLIGQTSTLLGAGFDNIGVFIFALLHSMHIYIYQRKNNCQPFLNSKLDQIRTIESFQSEAPFEVDVSLPKRQRCIQFCQTILTAPALKGQLISFSIKLVFSAPMMGIQIANSTVSSWVLREFWLLFLPLQLECKQLFQCNKNNISINCLSKYLAIIDKPPYIGVVWKF